MNQFQDDTIRVIFSFTDTDPDDITGLDYHGSFNRGTKSVIVLNYNGGSQSLPEDAISLDVVVSEVCGNKFEIINIILHVAFFWNKLHYYRPQRSCDRVMILHLSVILITGSLCPIGSLFKGYLSRIK